MLFCDYELIDDGGQPAIDAIWWHKKGPRSATIALPRGRGDLDDLHVRMDNNFVGPCFLHRGVVAHALGAWSTLMGVEDYDYWMRLDNAFRIEHLHARGDGQRSTDYNGAAAAAVTAAGPLYRYRVHARSLPASRSSWPLRASCARCWRWSGAAACAARCRGASSAPQTCVTSWRAPWRTGRSQRIAQRPPPSGRSGRTLPAAA